MAKNLWKNPIQAVLLFALVVTVVVWFRISDLTFSFNYNLRNFSHLFAVVGFVFILFQFILSARVKWLEQLLGLDKMLFLHKRYGVVGWTLIFLHLLLILVYEVVEFGSILFWAGKYYGLTAFILMTITAFTAKYYKNLKLSYEFWRNLHKVNGLVFIFILVHVFLNAVSGSWFYYQWAVFAAVFGGIGLHKGYKYFQVRNNPYEVVSVSEEAERIWNVCLKGKHFDYKPGQFMFVSLKRDGKTSEEHPFTISSSPAREEVCFTPKELGDFTSTIKDTKTGDKAYIDGPYGVFSFLNVPGDKLVFIAGGIGITPFLSMLRYMKDKNISKEVFLFWGNKSEKEMPFPDEFKELSEELAGFTFVPVMSNQEDWPHEKGHITGDLIKKYVENYKEYEFFICGPPPMLKAVLKALADMGVSEEKIHVEVFEL